MKVTILSREYPPDSAWGGIASFYYSLSRALAERGHEVHIICQAVAGPREYEDNGVFVHRVGTNPKQYSALARINYSFHAWLKLRELIRKRSTEVVEATHWGAEAFLYSLRKPVPLVVRLEAPASDILRTKCYSGLKELLNLKILSILEDFSTKRADRIIAISKDLYARAIDKLHIDPEKLDLVHHGIDTSKYRFVSSDVRTRLGIPQESPLVLFAGRLEARKGLHILCQAIPEVIRSRPGTKFVLVGRDTGTSPVGGSFKAYLSQQAQSHGFSDNLMLLEFLSSEELVQLYSACDVFVLPSLEEGFGMVILEAMACGKAVVTTSAGGAGDIGFTPPSGIIVPPNAVTELAQALISLLSLDAEDKKLIAKKNRGLMKAKFSIHAWVDKVIGVYEKALRKHQNQVV